MLEKESSMRLGYTISCSNPVCGRTEIDENVCIFCTSKQETLGKPKKEFY